MIEKMTIKWSQPKTLFPPWNSKTSEWFGWGGGGGVRGSSALLLHRWLPKSLTYLCCSVTGSGVQMEKMWAEHVQRPALDTPHGMSLRPTLGTEYNMNTFF